MYRLNGHDLTLENQCKPTKHSVSYTKMQTVDTIGASILIAPPSGIKRVHTWYFDRRSTKVVDQLLTWLDFDTSPVVLIDTYDVRRDSGGNDILLTNLVCTVEKPEISTAGKRSEVDSFSIVLTEVWPM